METAIYSATTVQNSLQVTDCTSLKSSVQFSMLLLLAVACRLVQSIGNDSVPRLPPILPRPLSTASQSLSPDLVPTICEFLEIPDIHKLTLTAKSLHNACYSLSKFHVSAKNNSHHHCKEALLSQKFKYLLNNTELVLTDLMNLPCIFNLTNDTEAVNHFCQENPTIPISIGIEKETKAPFMLFQLRPVNHLRWYHLFTPLFVQIRYPSDIEYCIMVLFPPSSADISIFKYDGEKSLSELTGSERPRVQFIENILKSGEFEWENRKWTLMDKQTIFQKIMFNTATMFIIDCFRFCLLLCSIPISGILYIYGWWENYHQTDTAILLQFMVEKSNTFKLLTYDFPEEIQLVRLRCKFWISCIHFYTIRIQWSALKKLNWSLKMFTVSLNDRVVAMSMHHWLQWNAVLFGPKMHWDCYDAIV